ncbi:MAG: glycosyltransferase family A protein [Chloroflexota bacterium]
MFCSTIIPTVGRDHVNRAVQSVLDQQFDPQQFEIIVVNDSGKPLPEHPWQQNPQVIIIHTQKRERCMARNSGAAIAKGQYLHFLDDDDWMMPNFLTHFHKLAQRSTAVWLYGATQLVDRDDQPLIQLHHGLKGNCFVHVMAGEWIPLQSSLINAETFFKVGGFNPLIPGSEDIDLLRRVALVGDIDAVDPVVAQLEMGLTGSTTDYDWSALMARWAREAILNESNAFKRLQDSANGSEWQGRILRLYLTSMVWNLKNRRGLTAVSRFNYAGASFFYAGSALLSAKLWQAVKSQYESPTFLKGFEAANIPVGRRELNI